MLHFHRFFVRYYLAAVDFIVCVFYNILSIT